MEDLINISTEIAPTPQRTCQLVRQGNHGCRDKARELLNRIDDNWNPNRETPQRHNLWHTPRRIIRYEKADPQMEPVLYNPDTRSTLPLLEGIRIFSKAPGHKLKDRDPYLQGRPPARINNLIEPTMAHVTINTDGSAIRNGWENAIAGIGVWYDNGSNRNIALRLESQERKYASNSRAELCAILEALKQNETDDLKILSDSLTSLRAICTDSAKYEDQNWHKVKNADLLKSILIRLRTRPACTTFKWVKGHAEENYGNSRADALADQGRESDQLVTTDEEEWINDHPALQDGARLQALTARQTYGLLLEWYSKKVIPIKHQEVLDDAKEKIEELTGLRPTNEKLLKGIKMLRIPPRIKDHLRNMLVGGIKCGSFWDKIPGHTSKAHCTFCKSRTGEDIIESEEHMWLQCQHSGQAQAWETTKRVWSKTTDKEWPNITIGLIKGTAALTYNDFSKDAERLRILIPMTIWAIWKSKIKNSINNQDVAPNETSGVLKGLITDLITKNWNASYFLESDKKKTRQDDIKRLWAGGRFAMFDPLSNPILDFS